MTYEEYLIKKRINKSAFEAGDPVRFAAWQDMYAQMHPNSFLVAVKMQINNVRLRYHLAEENIPKAAPVTAAPKPAARRAVPAAATATKEITAQPTVSQETPKEGGAAPKPRPVVRRPVALPKLEKQEEVEGKEAVEQKPEAKPRPVIKRPVIGKPAATQEEKSVTAEGESIKPAEESKPAARPRPVIKRPAALQKSELSQDEASAKPETPAESNADKPVRPRPVIKRPAALSKPAEEDKPVSEDTPKPIRPRPIIKRPAALQKPTVNEEVSENDAEAGQGSLEEEKKQASPRPRPIIKRPSKPAEPVDLTATPEGKEELPKAEEEEVKPKPPRPRPVIRRPPPKPDETGV